MDVLLLMALAVLWLCALCCLGGDDPASTTCAPVADSAEIRGEVWGCP